MNTPFENKVANNKKNSLECIKIRMKISDKIFLSTVNEGEKIRIHNRRKSKTIKFVIRLLFF